MFYHTANKYNEAPLKIILINSKLLSFCSGWLNIFCISETKSTTAGLCLGGSAQPGCLHPQRAILVMNPRTAQNKTPSKTGKKIVPSSPK